MSISSSRMCVDCGGPVHTLKPDTTRCWQCYVQSREPTSDGPNPSGFCLCGCGRLAPLARVNLSSKGYVKGKPQKFIPGHRLSKKPESERGPLFWDRVKIGQKNECWPFLGTPHNHDGHCQFTFNGEREGAHRLAWILTNGEIPDGFWVLHKCDNPPCCNPDHLFLGSIQDNIADMVAKGRNVKGDRARERNFRRGSEHGCAKLTENSVIEIRIRHANGEMQTTLAHEFGVTKHAIWRIVNRITWGHIK